ncbi:acyl-CoA dehydrogenase [Aneurinibacillus aneurinilyticus]|jgi:alkylation response protein AidB-like acyl-CoA dehydrogenase|uniref:Acyl-CoA dehydrogenase n=2 Tax=Aneurinibacillus aneurinilyticus TaxID=1391 RepID=A0A848CY13_ANEAE|nr:acyl-CoA dehydrogenase [Aneurinibacillus aneurinilyticus]ERI09900.1 butyryl-CoA dehydrogenase [Aneurinibacillus aneurinilyticus ATCC 12856]MCI1695431.1 acyl-CoA dehydrogenase [Aneurinibacillus aneurinilyticus]MED0673245.1 acyl-CoA dehydrogenase [Aneurinibacillus aneurinilyticus]MED0706740.1 acyl-CoA dehydrogenase [Aneurinibacillus aneurinilyticus]MED0725703.1 acyl-CoA dehydrogenase [Aneurinibacillus aneurinilyticus]
MNFTFTEEQQMIKNLIRDFAEGEVAPGADERDKTGEFPLEVFKKMAKLDLMGLPFPEEYGGGGADTISFAIVTEELSRVCASTGITYSAHISLGGAPINMFGTHEQKQTYLTPLARGEYFGAFGLTEPNAGSDAGGTRTTAVKKGNEWVINGSKCYITNASYAKALALTAVTDKSKGTSGITAFIVPTDAKGFSVVSDYEKMGLHASNTTQLFMEDVHIPHENILGLEGNGFKQFLATLDGGRIGIGAMAVGIAQGAYEKALAYANERTQFGQTLSKFQAIQFKLADMAMNIELARNMVHKAAWLKDQGRKFSKEAAMAKLFASEMCMRVCDQAVQIHGGNGYMREYQVERFFRDAKLLEIGEGTSEVLRIVISREIGCK